MALHRAAPSSVALSRRALLLCRHAGALAQGGGGGAALPPSPPRNVRTPPPSPPCALEHKTCIEQIENGAFDQRCVEASLPPSPGMPHNRERLQHWRGSRVTHTAAVANCAPSGRGAILLRWWHPTEAAASAPKCGAYCATAAAARMPAACPGKASAATSCRRLAELHAHTSFMKVVALRGQA